MGSMPISQLALGACDHRACHGVWLAGSRKIFAHFPDRLVTFDCDGEPRVRSEALHSHHLTFTQQTDRTCRAGSRHIHSQTDKSMSWDLVFSPQEQPANADVRADCGQTAPRPGGMEVHLNRELKIESAVLALFPIRSGGILG